MTIKRTIIHVIMTVIIATTGSLYTKESQDDNNKSITSVSTDQQHIIEEFDPETSWKKAEETFYTVTKQTDKIEYALQQLELILKSDSININSSSGRSKTQLLEEISAIKSVVQEMRDVYTTTPDLQTIERIEYGNSFNYGLLNYLTPCIQNDFTQVSIEDLIDHISKINLEEIINPLFEEHKKFGSMQAFHNVMQIIIDENEVHLKILIESCETAGLSSLNKWYRYLDEKPLSWTGKSTIATLQDIAFYGGLVGTSLYVLAAYNTKLGYDLERCDNDVIKSVTAKECYIPGTKIPFYFKNWIGHKNLNHLANSGSPVVVKFAQDHAGICNHIDDLLSPTNMITYIATWTFAQTTPAGKSLLEYMQNKLEKTVNYLRGDHNKVVKSKGLFGSSETPKVYFKDIIGGQHLEARAREIADYIRNPIPYERTDNCPETGILLAGPSQTGKSHFAQALKTLIDEECQESNNGEKIKFLAVTQDLYYKCGGFDPIFAFARKNAPFILFIDELDMLGVRRDKDPKATSELLTNMSGLYNDSAKKVFVIAATNRPEELDPALLQDGRFGKSPINFELPNYEHRKAYLTKALQKRNISSLDNNYIDSVAQETEGLTYNSIEKIIKTALRIAMYQTRPIKECDFEIALDREMRKITPSETMTLQDKDIIAIYQAGQALARHLLGTEKKVVKITINSVDRPVKPKDGFIITQESQGNSGENNKLIQHHQASPIRLGYVFTQSKITNQDLISYSEQEKELLALLAGQAALEIITGNIYNSFGKEDRANVIEILEKNISQGTPITDSIRTKALAEKEVLYDKVKKILQNHVPSIKKIVAELVKNRTINKHQWEELTCHITPKK